MSEDDDHAGMSMNIALCNDKLVTLITPVNYIIVI